MILKQLRISRLLSQEQLAQMSGLSVRTIQRIESGHKPSAESLKCLAAVFEVDIATLTQEKFVLKQPSDRQQNLPIGIRWLFVINFFSLRPSRSAASSVELVSHWFGFAFCLLGLVNEASLVGGLILLANAHLFRLHLWLGDKYTAWYDRADSSPEAGG